VVVVFGKKRRAGGPGVASTTLRSATMQLGETVEAVATQQHAVALRAILADRPEVPVLAELRVEPYNPVGVPVVGVYVGGEMVGRLPREAVERRREDLLAVARDRGAVVVDAVVRPGAYPTVTLLPGT
jgi:hypothetical protein